MTLRLFASAALAVAALIGCHSSRENPEGQGAPSAAPTTLGSPRRGKPPAPLDTSWQQSPGRPLAVGDAAPDFEGIAHTGMRVRLAAFGEAPVVVLFYPGDRDQGSITEAREFRDAWLRFGEKIGMVVGVSPDDRTTHKDFATAEQLPFLLVSDQSLAIVRAFGVPVENGRPRRTTFVVGKGLKVVRVFPDVVAEGHAADVLRAIDAHQ